uniref:Tubulin/FtsZ 2-layer sandwich domain-containing protein n=1 Tax=Fagus sylvatica TaxID=28930 RepID=A0A2N9ISM7_FAGSY
MSYQPGIVGPNFLSAIDMVPGLVNVDFADVRAIMKDAGSSLMGIGTATGKTRARDAALNAIQSPLLDIGIERATGIVWNITGGSDLTLFEASHWLFNSYYDTSFDLDSLVKLQVNAAAELRRYDVSVHQKVQRFNQEQQMIFLLITRPNKEKRKGLKNSFQENLPSSERKETHQSTCSAPRLHQVSPRLRCEPFRTLPWFLFRKICRVQKEKKLTKAHVVHLGCIKSPRLRCEPILPRLRLRCPSQTLPWFRGTCSESIYSSPASMSFSDFALVPWNLFGIDLFFLDFDVSLLGICLGSVETVRNQSILPRIFSLWSLRPPRRRSDFVVTFLGVLSTSMASQVSPWLQSNLSRLLRARIISVSASSNSLHGLHDPSSVWCRPRVFSASLSLILAFLWPFLGSL